MERLSTTPFGQRPVTFGLLQATKQAANAPALPHIDKWELLRTLCDARAAYQITDRELGVLEALLSFHPGKLLDSDAGLVVFPSNRALALRCHGMAESTLRRHLARLVDTGLIRRHDSPNGKRYARRDPDGELLRAFGFDLSPLLIRAPEIAQAADVARTAAIRLRDTRERISLHKRDAQKLALYGQEQGHIGPWETLLTDLLDVTRLMRRKLTLSELKNIAKTVENLLGKVLKHVSNAEEMSGNHHHIERQHQNSHTEPFDSETAVEKNNVANVTVPKDRIAQTATSDVSIPLPLVLRAVPEALEYAQGPITRFDDLARLGAFLRGMIGISTSAWDDAVAIMGSEVAGITICCLVQRISDIRSPGGYLRRLTEQARMGKYSVTRGIMALIQRSQTLEPAG